MEPWQFDSIMANQSYGGGAPAPGGGLWETLGSDVLSAGMGVMGAMNPFASVASSLATTLAGGLNAADPIETFNKMADAKAQKELGFMKDSAQNMVGHMGQDAETLGKAKFGEAGRVGGMGQMAEGAMWSNIGNNGNLAAQGSNLAAKTSGRNTNTLINAMRGMGGTNAAGVGAMANQLSGQNDNLWGTMANAGLQANQASAAGINSLNSMHNENVAGYKGTQIDPYAVSRAQTDMGSLANSALASAQQSRTESTQKGADFFSMPLASANRLAGIGATKDATKMYNEQWSA